MSSGGGTTTSEVKIPEEAKPYLYGNETTKGLLPEASNIYSTQTAIGPYQDQQYAAMNPVQNYGLQTQSQVGDVMANTGVSGINNLNALGLNYLSGGAEATNNAPTFNSLYNSGGSGTPAVSASSGPAMMYVNSGNMPPVAPTVAPKASKNANYQDNINDILGMKYRNPYLEETIQNAQDSASQAWNRNIMPALRSGAIGAGQYGSSRDYIAQGLAAGDFGRSLTDATSNAYSGAYNQNYNAMTGLTGQLSGQASAEKVAALNRAAAMAQASAAAAAAEANSKRDYDLGMRQLGLASMNAIPSFGNLGIGGSQAIYGAGLPYQTQNQNIYDLGRTNEMNYRNFDQQMLNNYQQSVIPGAGMGQTQTAQNNPGALETIGTLGNLGLAGYLAFSDRRLKKNIVKIGTRDDGINIYRFDYLWDNGQHIGVMADEVEKVIPAAVVDTPSGYKAVNYAML